MTAAELIVVVAVDEVRCKFCRAKPGDPCRTVRGPRKGRELLGQVHAPRWSKARRDYFVWSRRKMRFVRRADDEAGAA